MNSLAVHTAGVPRLSRTLKQAAAKLGDLRPTHVRIGALVLAAANARVPKRTGRLAASGRSSGTKRDAIVRFGNARVRYAAVVHWGWPRRGIDADTYAVDAAKATETTWMSIYTEDVQKILDGVQGV